MKSTSVQGRSARYQRPRFLKIRAGLFRIIPGDHKFPNSPEIVENGNSRSAKHNRLFSGL
jgi:hypothetical protein